MRIRESYRIFAQCARATALRLGWPIVAATIASWVCVLAVPGLPGTGPDGDVAARLWLHLPCLLLASAAVGAALESWPLLSRDRAGAVVIRRLHPPGVDGCVPAIAGALVALAGALGLAAAVFTGILHSHDLLGGDVRAHAPFEIQSARPILGPSQRTLRLRGTTAEPVTEVRLHALAFWRPGPEYRPPKLWIRAAGRALHPDPLRVEGSHELLVVPVPTGPLPEIEIEADPGAGIELLFLPDSVEAVVAGARSPLWNAVLAAQSYLAPVALALAAACVARSAVGLPIALLAGVLWVLLSGLFGGMPNASAIADYAARRWLPAENLLETSARSLCMVGLLFLAAAVIGRRRSR